MKKIVRFGALALISLSLASCSILEGLLGSSAANNNISQENSLASNASNGGASQAAEVVDSSTYGTGAESATLTVDADIPHGKYIVFAKDVPEGYHAEFAVYKSASTAITNVYWADEFDTTSMCNLLPGQVVVAKYCTFQNVNSNPEIGELKNGCFQVGTHFQLKNKVLKIKGLGRGGQYEIYSKLENGSFYSDPNLISSQITNLINPDEVVSIPYIDDGAYVKLDSAEIVVEA